ncbi:MAG TPA: serine hydrolase domain-containing protein [Candidatus Nitrosopolaris sp.]
MIWVFTTNMMRTYWHHMIQATSRAAMSDGLLTSMEINTRFVSLLNKNYTNMIFLRTIRNRLLLLLSFSVLFVVIAIAPSETPITIAAAAAAAYSTKLSPLLLTVSAGSSSFEINDNLKQIIRTLVDNKTNAAVVIGLVDANGTQFYGYGKTSNATNATTVNENTLFDIGSITKTFTTTLLDDIIGQGIVKLDDPIEKYLPSTVRAPTINGIDQILLQLQLQLL